MQLPRKNFVMAFRWHPWFVGNSWVFGLAFCIGCGGGVTLAPVSGTITFEGEPLVGASITTQPIAADSRNPGSGSFGLTDEQGHFELELVTPAKKGAIVGKHRVMISRAADNKKAQDLAKDEEPEAWSDDPNDRFTGVTPGWPQRFTDGSLELIVPPEGNTNANFELTK